jgi:hypothetical protein
VRDPMPAIALLGRRLGKSLTHPGGVGRSVAAK